MKNIYVHVLAKLPEWQQDLVMENRRPILLSAKAAIRSRIVDDIAYKTNGLFVNDTNHIQASLGSGFSGNELEFDSSYRTLSHEKGHQFDYDIKERRFFSDGSSAFGQALAREQATGWRGENILGETFGNNNIHAEYFGIKRHVLDKAYRPEQLVREATAQMTAVYNIVYNEYRSEMIHGKDYFLSDSLKNKELPPYITPPDFNKKVLEKTEALMERIYPELFPVYRDEFIPHAVKKASDLAKAIDIEEKKIIPKITKYAKLASAMLPTNIDNLAIAGGAGVLSAGWSKFSGESIVQSAENGIETASEISGFAAAQSSWEAGKKGNFKEASIQAVDALGIPAVAVREGISIVENSPRLNDSCANAGMTSMTHTINRIDKPEKPVFPEAIPNTKLLEKIAQKLKKSGMMPSQQQAEIKPSAHPKFIPYSATPTKKPNVTPS